MVVLAKLPAIVRDTYTYVRTLIGHKRIAHSTECVTSSDNLNKSHRNQTMIDFN